MGPRGSYQRFFSAILVKGKFSGPLVLTAPESWVETELNRFSGNLIAQRAELASGEHLGPVGQVHRFQDRRAFRSRSDSVTLGEPLYQEVGR